MKAISNVAVLITAIGGGGYGGQILKALRLAPAGRYTIVGADASSTCPQFSLVDYASQLPRADSHDYFDVLFQLCDRYDVRAVFPGCEAELTRMSDARHLFEERGILLAVSSKDFIDTCLDKERTNARLIELGYAPPRYLKVTDRKVLEAIDWFPVVVKPSLGGGGSANCFIAQNQKELMALCDYLGFENIAGSFLVQEYVGTPEEEYTVGILHDLDGNYINSIAIRRVMSGQLNIRSSVANRTGRSELGPKLVISSGVSQGYIGRFPEVTAQCREIAQAMGALGAVNIQCRLVEGAVRVFEINPRFSGTTSLRAMMGYNEPDALVCKHLLHLPVDQDFAYDEGLIMRGLCEYKVD